MIRAIHIVKSSVDFIWISIIHNKSKYFLHIHWTEMKKFLFFSFSALIPKFMNSIPSYVL